MRFFCLVLCISFFASAGTALAKGKSAKETIEGFFKEYMPLTALTGKKASLTFSKSFQKLDKKNKSLCVKYADGLCGWDASGDPYLNAQEYDSITFETAGGIVTEEKPGKVRVKMNVYPSLTENKKYYDRDILFVMKKESGSWVLDDIIYSSEDSARKRMKKEIEETLELKKKK